MQFGILGPLVVWRDGREVPIGAAKQRTLLAVLLLRRGEFVPTETLIEELWAGRPPPTAAKALQVYVSQLRKLLGEGLIETRPVGYLLRLEPDALDAARFERMLTNAQALVASGEERKAGELVREALGFWRGPPLVEFRYDDFARDAIARLEGLRLVALELRLETDVALGRHADAVPELAALVREHPLRESLRELLILALYRAGRQADALAAYQEARTALVDGLGLDPSTSLQQLETAILRHDPKLDRADHATVSNTDTRHENEPRDAPRAAGRRAHPRRRRLLSTAIAGLLVVCGLIAVRVVVLGGSDAAQALSHVDVNAVGLINPGTNRIVDEVPVGATPSHFAVGDGAIWVTNADGGTVSRIDPVTNAVVQTIAVGSGPSGITAGSDAIWVANSLENTVSRIDPTTNRMVQSIHVGNGPVGIAYGAGSVWVANTGDDTITRIDAKSGIPANPLPIAATELDFGAGTLWASQQTANRVVRIDPASGTVIQPITVGNGPAGIVYGKGAAWVANSGDGTVSRINPLTNSVTNVIPTGDGPTAVAVGAGSVWVSNEFGGTLVRIDPRTNQLVRRIRVGNRPLGVAISSGDVLVSVRQSGAGHRGGRLIVRMNRPPDSIDPVLSGDTTSVPFMRMTGDGLVAFDQTTGLQGTRLVPDLALTIPTPTDGGKTYTFRLRRNIRYSNGKLVKASDVSYTFERAFSLAGSYWDNIVGAAACDKTPKRCDLSRGIVTNDTAMTVTFHLLAPDSEFLYLLAFTYVVPAGTPPREAGKAGTPPVPATGPYMITSYRTNHSLTLRRNPHFHEWSKAAQPDGYPDTFVVEIGGTPDDAIAGVIRGKADVFSSSQSENPPSERRMTAIETRNPSQVHTNPQPTTIALFLNTRLAPFNRLDVRKALNYAVNRAAAIQALGGPEVARVTCQILPPGFEGYRRYCPFTAGTTTRGNWKGPDLTEARALITRSGTRGMKITVWSWANLPGLGPFTVKLLQSLGYRASLKVAGGDRYFSITGDSRTKAQIGTFEWLASYPAASGWFDPIFTCASFTPNSPNNANDAEFCDPRLDRLVKRALVEQATNPDAADSLWERVDRQTVDQAPWVPLVNPNVVDVLSKRVGDYQYNPAGFGMLIDQLWVR